jgi:alkylhydroperoxidase family enzyme
MFPVSPEACPPRSADDEGGPVSRIPLTDPDQLAPSLRELYDSSEDWPIRHAVQAFGANSEFLEDYFAFYLKYCQTGLVPRRTKELVRLRIATLNNCSVCSAARLAPDVVSEDEALASLAGEGGLDESEKAAIAYAEKMAADHHSIGDADVARLREHYNDAEFLELTMMIGQFIGFGRVLATLQLENVVCTI